MYPSHQDLEGYYLDGQTATRQRAIVIVLQEGLQITTESGAIRWWPYEEIRQNQDGCAKGKIRLERGREIAETLILPSHLFFGALEKIRPKNRTHFHVRSSGSRRIFVTALAAVSVVAISASLYLWAIPTMARVVASYVPISWEAHLGEAVMEHLAPEEKRCLDPSRINVLEGIAQILLSSSPGTAHPIRIIVVNDRLVNAFALPGGYMILCQGLLERTEGPEELAGVMAHELQHILHRHPTQALLQEASMRLLLAALTGDTKMATKFGLEGAKALGTLRYSRQKEEEADEGAVKMLLRAGIDPMGMIRFLEKLHREESRTHDLPTYLSSHPNLEGRISRLRSLANSGKQRPKRSLVVDNWNRIRFFCPARARVPF